MTIADLPAPVRWALAAAFAGLAWLVLALAAPQGAPPGAVLQGVVLGSATALTSLGLILIWRANRFINFAQMALGGAVGLTAAHLFLTWHWPYPVALALGVIGGVGLGALVEVLIIRRFSRATRLVLTVASLGLAQLLGGMELLLPKGLFGVTSFVLGSYETPLSGELFTMSSIRFNGNYLLIVAVVPLAAAGLAWVLLRTSAGIAIRASAENNDRALLLGIPVTTLHSLVWAIAGGLATLTFLLRAPIVGSVSSAALGPTVLLPALTAALIARMESLPRAVVAAMALGALEGIIRWNWPPEAVDVVNLAVILIALLAQRRGTSRAHDADGTWQDTASARALDPRLAKLPIVRIVAGIAIALGVAGTLALPFLLGPSALNALSISVIWAIVGVSLVAMTGWNGQISLGQFAIVGVGAIVAGNLMARWDVDMFVALAAAAAAGMLTALVLGVPALRIRGPFLAVVTLAFAAMLNSFVLNPDIFPSIVPQDVERPAIWDRFPLDSERTMFYLCIAGLALSALMARGARRARSGRLLLAARDNRKAAEAMSVNARRAALQGFLLAGSIAGLAGGLHVLLLRGARKATFEPPMSIEAFSHTTIGGLGSLGGAIAGSIGLRSLEGELGQGGKLLLNGVGLLVVLYVIPGGVASAVARLRDLATRRLARTHGFADAAPTFETTTSSDSTGSPADAGASGFDADRLAISARDVCVSYGSLQVLFGVDLEVRRGEMVALLGTNGAGKSTLLKAMCGLTPASGAVRSRRPDGTIATLSGRRADRIVRDGVALMPGGKSIFPTLTVAEHLRLATWTFRHDHARIDADLADVASVFPSLNGLMGRMAGDLSGGEQQQLALAQTLMLRPEVLMIDELSLGLAPSVVASLLEIVRRLHDGGMTIVLVEQSVNIALHLAERAVFMEKGAVRFEGPTRDLLDRPDILRAVFLDGAAGDPSDDETVAGDAPPAPVISLREPTVQPVVSSERAAPVLETHGVIKRFGGVVAVDEVDLAIAPGTIVGLVGQNGAGKTTLLDCISGFHTLDSGRLSLRGVDVTDWAPWQRARGRMGRSFQEARLFPSLTVAETVAVAFERNVASRSMVADVLHQPASFEAELATAGRVDEILNLLGLDEHRRKLTAELSTGMRRIVELACLLAADPVVLLLDEPSAGVAQRDAEALAPLLLRIRDTTGAALLVIEHDMALLRSMCDEMVALELGAVIARGTPEEVLANERVISGYLGTDSTAIERSDSAVPV
ncbi:MAG: ATP-binding cassette domain-containing protein [Acidimicrobiales bacterium]